MFDFFDIDISHEHLFFDDGSNIGFVSNDQLYSDSEEQIGNYKEGSDPCFENDELMAQAVENVDTLNKYRLVGKNY